MKPILGACIACVLLASPAHSDLTQQDLDKIRLILKDELQEELEPIKADIGKLQVEVATLSARVDGLDKSLNARVDGLDKMMTWLMVLIVAAVGISQFILTWRSRRDATLEKRIEEVVRQNLKMAEDIEILKQQRIARS